ncbi:putative interferon-induced guanylate-binding protein [Hibiscus syriacus]|uniref:Interferon-induced guanylate-binding protein n=1 Tax=Hibiscus syriacus TaxID=106335 RepID=A0A6A3ABS2_HIBSY|nr:protein ELC-like [Hibiscus syriacus]KAE8701436.1 putative interferon-induced guanylate-binding protein [Hibiscus syriacus]
MAPPSPKEIIEAALFAAGPYALSYSDSKQKWLILRHLLSLLQEFPGFEPSTGWYMQNDGTEVNLLRATGFIHVSDDSSSTPPVPLVIWLHENYPQRAPLVFVSIDPETPIHRHHPFVDNTSGEASSPYLITWKHPSCDLTGLLRNLVHLFSIDHPFSYTPTPAITTTTKKTKSLAHPSLVSHKEALDRLVGMLHYDMVALQASTCDEIENLSLLQEELKRRDSFTTAMIDEMDEERKRLKERADDWADEKDRLVNWLRVNDGRAIMGLDAGDVGVEDAFEMDEMSRARLETSAADLAIEDVLYKLDKALELEALSFDSYIKLVRSLAREQFFHKHKEMELNESTNHLQPLSRP